MNQNQRMRAHQRARRFTCSRDLRAYAEMLDRRFSQRAATAVLRDRGVAAARALKAWSVAYEAAIRGCQPGATSAGWDDQAHGLRDAFVRCGRML